ncbi:unnamed protein product [Prorocentrum cordatum]|uniref:FHA domain-containing protein n=1 Tax=Prorocentrum cordatum TaxID=2364126 RepID=A0ABN9WAC3_9DINO|nr:unnamed protein product [Polarella glacialis]
MSSDREGMLSFASNVRAALTALCQAKDARESSPLLEAALAQSRLDIGGLVALVQEIWELHAYFVFLDVKGDQALLETAAAQLCRALRCTAEDLVLGLARTGHWVEQALGMLSEQACGEMLQRCHARALQQWRAAWAERVQSSQDLQPQHMFGASGGKQEELFWASCFQQRGSVTWAVFLDGFERFHLRGRCPADIADQLRAELGPDLVHVVRRSDWHAFVKEHGDAASLVDCLLSKVLADIADRVYRSQPLDAGLLVGEAERDWGQVEPFPQASIVTPLDPGGTCLPIEEGKHVTWDAFCRQLAERTPCWWRAGGGPAPHQRALQARAFAAVSSGLACTRRALVLRAVSGSLASGGSARAPGAPERAAAPIEDQKEAAELPAVVVTANVGQPSGVAQVLDLSMNVPIALRSHFDVVYEPTTDRYSIMDVGSKWGTFVKVTGQLCLSCGDWIRLGNVELVIRCCGGGCANHRCHANTVGSLRKFGRHRSSPESASAEWCCDAREAEEVLPRGLGSVRAPGWHTRSEQITVPPLEIVFVTGPRMGEKLVLTKRVNTMGRSNTATVQITDAVLTNISRVHCVFECIGGLWHLRDNGSTNGTWQRLSCVLQPSAPKPLSAGMSVLAGALEFLVEGRLEPTSSAT